MLGQLSTFILPDRKKKKKLLEQGAHTQKLGHLSAGHPPLFSGYKIYNTVSAYPTTPEKKPMESELNRVQLPLKFLQK